MRDVFYTILVVWVLWRIVHSVNAYKRNNTNPSPNDTRGKTTVDYVPPKKKSVADNEGEYVDYEEIK